MIDLTLETITSKSRPYRDPSILRLLRPGGVAGILSVAVSRVPPSPWSPFLTGTRQDGQGVIF